MLCNKWFCCLILLGVIAVMFPGKSDAGCVCNEKGTDYCSSCSGRRYVRPKHKYSDGNPDIDLSPIGDKCWCTKKMIQPAVLPKPVEKKKTCDCGKTYGSCSCGKTCSCGKSSGSCGCGSSSSSSSSSSYDSESSIFTSVGTSSTYVGPQPSYVPTLVKDDNSLPADPISVSLAIQAGKAIEVPEAKLAYGFVQKPIDGLPRPYISSVREENLYALNNDVIALKKTTNSYSKNKKAEEEYLEIEDEESQNGEAGNAGDDDDEQPRLTYKQLGYVAEQYKNPTFEKVESIYDTSSSSSIGSEPYVVSGKISVDCGYRPGRISTMRRYKQKSASRSCN